MPIATRAPPASSANENEEPAKRQVLVATRASSAANEATRRGASAIVFEPADEDDAAEAEINTTFRARLMGLRRLPRYQRAQARQAAREWRLQALKALREKRASERRARHAAWRSQLLVARPAGGPSP